MTPFLKKIKQKGYLAKEVAQRWGITPRQLSNISRGPKQKDWDALNGIFGKQELKLLNEVLLYHEDVVRECIKDMEMLDCDPLDKDDPYICGSLIAIKDRSERFSEALRVFIRSKSYGKT